MLKTLATFLSSRIRSGPVMDRIEVTKMSRYGTCEKNPTIIVQTMPDGTRTSGTFDEDGKFKPFPEGTSK